MADSGAKGSRKGSALCTPHLYEHTATDVS